MMEPEKNYKNDNHHQETPFSSVAISSRSSSSSISTQFLRLHLKCQRTLTNALSKWSRATRRRRNGGRGKIKKRRAIIAWYLKFISSNDFPLKVVALLDIYQ